MSEGVTFKTFPSTECEALALLYVQNQDLTGKTPTEIQKMYYSAKNEITENWKNLTRK